MNADSGARQWQRFDIAWRTEPGCAHCGWESYYLRNFDWLITPQCSVAAGDSFAFWFRAAGQAYRESVEVWVSSATPRLADFSRLGASGTDSVRYQRRRYDLADYLGRRVFLALVYRSHNRYGVMVDDVSGPTEWHPRHDAGVTRIAAPGAFLRVGRTTRPACWVRNGGTSGEWVRVSCEVVGLWRDEAGVALAPGESSLVSFPELSVWQPGTYRVVFATHLAEDQRSWNDSLELRLTVSAFQSRGGPDSLGYAWFDSDDPLGPAYRWEELHPTGTLLLWGDDTLCSRKLDWPFPFYGQEYSTVFVCTNGWLAFGPPAPGNPSGSNVGIPNRYSPNRLVAPFWDDLDVRGGEGGVWSKYFGDSLFVVEWWRTRRKGCASASLNFEAKLFRTGAIEFHYAGVDVGDVRYDGGMSATVGIENSYGTVGLEYLGDGSPPGNLLSSGRAVRFVRLPPGVEEDGSPPHPGHPALTAVPVPGGALVRAFLPERTTVRVSAYDLSGRLAASLGPGLFGPGRVELRLSPPGQAGVYFIRLETPETTMTAKAVLPLYGP